MTPALVNTSTPNLEAFIASKATSNMWAASGGPPISGGIYATVFRTSSTGRTNRTGVTVTRSGATMPTNDFYFATAQSTRATVDAAATTTGANGSALVTGASITAGIVYSGAGGGLPAEGRYSAHAGMSLPFILVVQVLRPINAAGMTCPL